MKQRILNIMAVLFLMATTITATAQSISIADFEARPGRIKSVEINVNGVSDMTALQFNLSLPAGFSIDIFDYVGATGDVMSLQQLESDDYLVVIYNMYLKTFNDDLSLPIALTAPETAGTFSGSIYNIRMSTPDAVSHSCTDVAFTAQVTAPVVPEEEGLSTSKYYRIKNVSAQLYLQVNGNNSNMALQSKGDELTLSQIFSLEDAADGKFYIKSTTTDAKYYAHASGWNFNATTNADSRTSFTISLVDGEENVYTLYQDESTYTGLAGADATTAGTLIYCNKNVDQNGKWQFEALTADETNEYIAILTSAAKPALEAAIANAESIVEARKAVLGASEIAAIEAVVATAKAQKDNTTDVDKLNALTDAINAAISDAVYVWSLDDLSNTVCYAVSTESRGSWYSEEANLTGTDKAGVEFNVTDENQQFAFLQSEDSGYYYLYSVGAKKFVSASGSYTTLTDIPVETIIFLEGKRTDKFPWVVALNSTDGEKQIGVSNGYTPAVITSYNDLTDAGNTVRFEKVAAFDATAALADIEAYEASTAIEEVEMRDEKGEIYDLAGRKVVNPVNGIYIVNGQRVLIK